MHYVIRKDATAGHGKWVLFAAPDAASGLTRLASFKLRRQAVAHARLLAGWRGTVAVEG